MKNILKSTILFLCLAFTVSSCFTNTHIIGDGAQTGVKVEKKQWYALWGLVPIGTEPDTKAMAGKDDYTITTTHTFIDQLISAFTSIVTISVKTVQVQK
mgnify:CR=1 FL=1